MADVVESVELRLPGGSAARLANSELHYSYRHSTLPAGAVVVSAVLKLSRSTEKQKPAELRARFDVGLVELEFALRLRREPALRAAVETWPAEPDALDYVAMVDDEHEHRRTRRKRGIE